ncbi:terpene cyclase/mutase family protein [Patescibacteria group bacterium]|nr:terpene cyclase/mutase family protein [Patescibacteria group bacterium]
MKNQIIKIALLSFIIFCFYGTANADTLIHLNIKTPENILYDQDITVTPCDSDNVGTFLITAYCAIQQSGLQNEWNWDWAPGAFLNSLDDIAGYTSKDQDGNDVYHYWSWSLNGTEGITGLNQYELQLDDLISLDFIDPIDDPTPPTPTGNNGLGELSTPSTHFEISVTPEATAPEITPATTIKTKFNLQKAFEFIISQQEENGSFGENLYTDWTALALASGNHQEQTIKLIKYLEDSNGEDMSVTGCERHTMALLALGLNPYKANGENCIEKIIATFDGTQFGDANEDNDDIFALIVLQNVGFNQTNEIIINNLNFILSKQKEDGSWDSNVDMTGAAIEALSSFSLAPGVEKSLLKAREFLKQNQKDDGGWNNASSTAWVIEGILALSEKPEDWIKNNNSPFDYLATLQDTDGGIKNEILTNKLWETVYVVSALSGKTWNQIMQKFEKPKLVVKIKTPTTTKVAIKAPEKIIKKEILTATTINAITPLPDSTQIEQIEIQKENWFMRFLDKIFSIF